MSLFAREQTWDDEQIAKYGLFMHLQAVSEPLRAERVRMHAKLVEENIDNVLALLPDVSDETRARATFAIPQVITALSMPVDIVMANWRNRIAAEMYEVQFHRTSMMGPMAPFDILTPEEQGPFLAVIEAVVLARSNQ